MLKAERFFAHFTTALRKRDVLYGHAEPFGASTSTADAIIKKSINYVVRILLRCSVLLLLCVFHPIDGRAENEVQRLSASVGVYGRRFAVGDTIQIEAAVKNISSKPFYMYKGLFYSIHYIKLFMNGKPLRGYYLAQFGILGPTKDSFFLLQPNEESRILFEGKLEQTTIPDIMRQGHPNVPGVFLNFGTSAILIPGGGNYDLTFELSYSKEASADAQKQFGLEDVWHGTVKSPPLEIMITQ